VKQQKHNMNHDLTSQKKIKEFVEREGTQKILSE